MPSRPGAPRRAAPRRQLRISARVSPSPVIIIAERALLSSFFPPFLFAFLFFFLSATSLFPFDPSTGMACRKPGNVTSLIIGVVKRVVRNNYEPVPRCRRVTRALSSSSGRESISSLAREARFRIYTAPDAREGAF